MMPSARSVLAVLRGVAVAALLGEAVPLAAAGAPAPQWVATGFREPVSALYVPAEKAIYVSNLDGEPNVADGKGFISKLDEKGQPIKLDWSVGLDAPTGMGWAQGFLYVADVGAVLKIDTRDGSVVRRWNARGARHFADLALEPRSNFKGQTARVYLSDRADDAIWYLADNSLSKHLKDPALEAPTGLLVEGEELRIVSWGASDEQGLTPVPGRLKTLQLDHEGIADRFNGLPLGNLQGLAADGRGGYWVTDPAAGKLLHLADDGTPSVWLESDGGLADLASGPGRTLLVPLTRSNELRAYPTP